MERHPELTFLSAKMEGELFPQALYCSLQNTGVQYGSDLNRDYPDFQFGDYPDFQVETVTGESIQQHFESLLQYLIDILKRRSEPEFSKLSHAAARTELKLDDFLAWLGNMELLAGEDEQACAAIMDKCLYRLEQEGEMELIAALLSGDETTFKLFRTQAPELVHLPDATYEWYCRHYLDRYYPVRFILHHQGIEFPRA